MLTAHLPLSQAWKSKGLQGFSSKPTIYCRMEGKKKQDIKSSNKPGKAFMESSAPNNVGHQLLRLL